MTRTNGLGPQKMQSEEIVKELTSTREGGRELDIKIAQFLGWRSVSLIKTDPNTGSLRQGSAWAPPGSDQPSRLPHYTTQIQAAMELLNSIVPDHEIGISWERGTASAQIKDREAVRAATPSLALCALATLCHDDKATDLVQELR